MLPRPTPENHQPLASGPTHRFGGRFFRWLSLVCLLVYLLPWAIMRMPAYDHVVGTYYGPLLEWGFSLKKQDADVVIFGDSTAIFDVDAVQAGKALGLKVVNLPNTIGSLPVTREDVLNQYLQHNRAPRLLVFHFSPWNLDYRHIPQDELPPQFEGQDMLVRHGSARELAGYFSHHLVDLVELPFVFYAAVPQATAITLYHRENPFSIAAGNLGHMNFPLHAAPLEASCRFPPKYLLHASTQQVDTLVADYGRQSETMVYVAPVPRCVGSDILASRQYRGGTLAPPVQLAPRLFATDFSHIRAEGVSTSTDLFVKAVQQALARQARSAVQAGVGKKSRMPAMPAAPAS